MKLPARLRPSPALVISLIALFVSLGGVSYGVATGFIDSREIRNNTVRSTDLRNNDIRTKDLRNNEVRGIDIRNSTIQGRDVALATLTGEDIKESTLAEVPLATRAALANAVPALKPIPLTTVGQGATPATLLLYGTLTVTGACPADVSGPRAELRVQTTQADSVADGTGASLPDLDPGEGAQPVATLVSAGAPVVDSTPLVASTPTGTALSGVFELVASGAGAGSCRFQGHAVATGAPTAGG